MKLRLKLSVRFGQNSLGLLQLGVVGVFGQRIEAGIHDVHQLLIILGKVIFILSIIQRKMCWEKIFPSLSCHRACDGEAGLDCTTAKIR